MGCNVQQGDDSQQYCIVYLKVAKRASLKSSHHQNYNPLPTPAFLIHICPCTSKSHTDYIRTHCQREKDVLPQVRNRSQNELSSGPNSDYHLSSERQNFPKLQFPLPASKKTTPHLGSGEDYFRSCIQTLRIVTGIFNYQFSLNNGH